MDITQLMNRLQSRNQEDLHLIEGLKKPFQFQRLPREVRDLIYIYSLTAPHLECHLGANKLPMFLPTPGLLSTNKQLHCEGTEILFSKNIFSSYAPDELEAFQEHIGLTNCNRIRELCINMVFPAKYVEPDDDYREFVDQEFVDQKVYEDELSDWITMLKDCHFGNIVHLSIQGGSVGTWLRSLVSMPKELQDSIEKLMGRVEANVVPRLSLTGFVEEDREKFPKNWKVEMNHSSHYIDEFERMQKEGE